MSLLLTSIPVPAPSLRPLRHRRVHGAAQRTDCQCGRPHHGPERGEGAAGGRHESVGEKLNGKEAHGVGRKESHGCTVAGNRERAQSYAIMVAEERESVKRNGR
jgi:hypothetical protein